MEKDFRRFLRKELFPSRFCPGCGHGILQGAVLRALDELDWKPEELVFVGGIGCAGSIATNYFHSDTLHVPHGRAITFASGVKIYKPELKVIVLTGDGDLSSIGGNHLLHAARRNIDLTVICANNGVFATTGGQVAPTTPLGAITATTPEGNPDEPLDLCEIVRVCGAGYVARSSVAHPRQIVQLVKKALLHRGFSFVDVISTCPVQFGRRNRFKSPFEMIQALKKIGVSMDESKRMEAKEKEAKMIFGEIYFNPQKIWKGYREDISAASKENLNG